MNDQQWLLQQLERWETPSAVEQAHAAIREAIHSEEHQKLGSRLRSGLRDGPRRPLDLPLAPPR
jgi:hypothetical protein